ncbi:MAG: dihydrofolate reductase family protein [Myxococcaceae bacterium]|nr:dihydrofolate reductase family protein [Myxococcaceae bacterium]
MTNRPRVSVYLGVSVDGCIARPDGALDWLDPFNDAAVGDYGYAAFAASVDAVVMGRATFDTVLGFGAWPYEGKRVVVMSGRPLPDGAKAERAQGALTPMLTRLHDEGVRHVYLDGGALVRQGLSEGVVDALTLSVMPLVLGAGRRLFDDAVPTARLTLVESQSFSNGVVQLRYAPRR